MLNREDVHSAWESFLKRELESQASTVGRAQDIARDSPGSNVTRSDQSRFNYSNLALGLEKVRTSRESALNAVGRLREQGGVLERVRVGSVVKVSVEETEINYYLIAPHAQGDKFDVGGQTVTAISTESPLGKLFLGREEGDDVKFKEK